MSNQPTRRAHGSLGSHWRHHLDLAQARRAAKNSLFLQSTSLTRSTSATNSPSRASRAEHIDGATPKPDRDAILKRLADGELDIITNCMVLTEGWDMPEVSAAASWRGRRRKWASTGRWSAACSGRRLGKSNAIVLDHSGAVFRHGFVEDRVDWTLNADKRAESPTHNTRQRSGYSSRLLECSKCASIRVAGEACGHCGFLPQRQPQPVVFKDGDLGAGRPQAPGSGRTVRSKRTAAVAPNADAHCHCARL